MLHKRGNTTKSGNTAITNERWIYTIIEQISRTWDANWWIGWFDGETQFCYSNPGFVILKPRLVISNQVLLFASELTVEWQYKVMQTTLRIVANYCADLPRTTQHSRLYSSYKLVTHQTRNIADDCYSQTSTILTLNAWLWQIYKLASPHSANFVGCLLRRTVTAWQFL